MNPSASKVLPTGAAAGRLSRTAPYISVPAMGIPEKGIRRRTESGLARDRRYNSSEKGRARRARYQRTPNGRERDLAYYSTPEAKMLQHMRDTKPSARLRRRLYMQEQRQCG